MPRYYRDKQLTITGIEPGSSVGVWQTKDESVNINKFQPGEEVFLEKCRTDTVKFPIPFQPQEYLIRIRNPGWMPMQLFVDTDEKLDGGVSVTQIRDSVWEA